MASGWGLSVHALALAAGMCCSMLGGGSLAVLAEAPHQLLDAAAPGCDAVCVCGVH